MEYEEARLLTTYCTTQIGNLEETARQTHAAIINDLHYIFGQFFIDIQLQFTYAPFS